MKTVLESIERRLREDPEGASVQLDEVLASLPPDSVETAHALALKATACLRRYDVLAAAQIAADAERIAAGLEDDETALRLAGVLASLLAQLGLNESAIDALQSALKRHDGAPDVTLPLRTNLASLHRAAGAVREAADAFDGLVDTVRGADLALDPAAVFWINAASTWWQVGRIDDAHDALDQARAVLGAENPPLQAWVRAIRAWLFQAQQDVERARALAIEAIQLQPDALDSASSAVRVLVSSVPHHSPDWPRVLEQAERLMERCSGSSLHGFASQVANTLASLAQARGDSQQEAHYLRIVTECERKRAATLQRQALATPEIRLQALSWQLESDLLRMRNATLSESQARLEVLAASRAQLLRGVAHDLRSPLTAVMLGIDSLDAYIPAGLQQDLLHATRQMQGILDTALSEGSVRSGESMATPTPRELGPTVRDAVRTFALPARRKELLVDVSLPTSLRAPVDPAALRRIVHNLVNNAIKFSPDGGRVGIELTAADGAVLLVITDDGPGFPADNPERLLLARTRGSNVGRADGHGVGLHTVYQLTTGHGGTVTLGNGPEGGARVIVRLPTAE